MSLEQKKRVCYFYDANVGNYHYGSGHPMKPHRIRMCHGLVMNYGLYKKMEIYRAKPANKWEMTQFHTDDYIDFLSRVTPENMDQFPKEQAKFNVGDDCPVFEGLFEYCGLSAGGSMEGAARLNRGLCDIAINWAGGLHHAKKAEASGFCYVNDIVLGILELLRYYNRVLYIDIDVHHGDGVEEAFYTTDRVMTCSFHKYGEFFPGTGELKDIGAGRGKYYSVNFPLRDGIDDESYKSVFEPVVTKVMEWYQPSAVVLQCGGDSLSGDKLGCFNLSMKGHANCVEFVKKFNVPTLVLGGGGYTMRNVARAWAYETGVVVGQKIGPDMPYNDYYEYFGPDYKLDVRPSNMENMNTEDYLEKIKEHVFSNLSRTAFAPSVQMQEVPNDTYNLEEEEEENPDDRYPRSLWDRRIVPDNEYYDSDEGEAQGTVHNLSSRNYRDYNEEEEEEDMDDGDDEDDGDYDGGDESDDHRVNGHDTTAQPSSSAASADDRMEVDPVSREEAAEIQEVMMEESVKDEPMEDIEKPTGANTPTIAANSAAPEGQDASSTIIAEEPREASVDAPTSETGAEPRNESLEAASPQPALGVPPSGSGMKSEEEGEVMSAKSTSPHPAPSPSHQDQQKQSSPAAVSADTVSESPADAPQPASNTSAPAAPIPQPATDEHTTPSQPLSHEQTEDPTGPNEGPRTATEGSVLEDGEIEDSA